VKYTRLQNCSLNQFAIVVTRRVSDRVSTVLGSYKCSSENQVQRKNTAVVGSSMWCASASFGVEVAVEIRV